VHHGRPGRQRRITFRDYVESTWLPSRQVEVSTLTGCRSYRAKHFLPHFGERQMAEILPASMQDRVTTDVSSGLSPTSVRKYHVMLHAVFKRAVRDRVIVTNPCESIELPKVPPRKARILAPEEYDRLAAEVPDRFRVPVMTDIETGLRWMRSGEPPDWLVAIHRGSW
jgi:site-specific recombinase XerD